MDEGLDRKQSAAILFGEQAEAYLESRIHREGRDLDQLVEWVGTADRALDVATGAGHTAGALLEADANSVVATDIAPGMITTTSRAFPDAAGAVCDAEKLPFTSESFDAVTCRIAAHHFPDPQAFVQEVARVLKPGGTFAFEDNIAPNNDTLDEFLNEIERIRDPTHVRSHRVNDWFSWLTGAGLTIDASRVVTKTLEFDEWVENVNTPVDRRARLQAAFSDHPLGAAETFEIVESDGNVESFANLKLLVKATR
ncbi:class I SAM-dependent methyltransferase [Halorubrum tropicale]|uniref:Ubiquinone biosynthesis methyltransferase UbiE n=1 Tax=Halorubrum tropicale TaxID=1765655 RepID=A0A0M9AMY9_9EURY|nr:class I SAM-dependent methyltransferase [Halorubrum tropicale]KOX95327.1 ubiquinone biosynthesis methyltransferase UbiE [Halorubrum tropicale]